MAASTVIRDPAIAVAVSKCLLFQTLATRPPTKENKEPLHAMLAAAHPRACRYCKVAVERKQEAINEFYEWSGMANTARPDGDPGWDQITKELDMYMRLPPEEQRRLANVAAGYEEASNGKSVTPNTYPAGAVPPTEVRGPVDQRSRSGQRGGRGQRGA